MSSEVLRRALGDRWRALAWWAGGLVVYVVFIASLWPSVRDSEDMQAAVEDYPEAFKAFFGGEMAFDMSTSAGFLMAQLFSLVVPLLLVIVAIGFAARTLAGEEEEGKLDLLLSYPVSRRRVLLEKAGALVAAVLGLGLVAWVALVFMSGLVSLDVGSAHLLAAVVGTVLAAVFYGAVTLLAGALTGQRGVAIGAGGMAFGLGYVLVVLADLSDGGSWVRYLSPHYYGTGVDPLTGGWPLGAHLVLVVLTVLAVVGAILVFERRDVAT